MIKMRTPVLLLLIFGTISCRPSKPEDKVSLTRDTLVYEVRMEKDTFLTTDTISGYVYYYNRYLEKKSTEAGKDGKPKFSVIHKRPGERYSDIFEDAVVIGTYENYRLTDEKLIERSIQVRNDTGRIRFILPDTLTKKITTLDLEVSALYTIISGDTGWVARTKFNLKKR